ncbi:LysR family transcriptional regulator [Bacillus stratosphericus]|nr:LysR family transcriptional regulator [Bacillus stratosphericus]
MLHLLEGRYFQAFIALLEERSFSRAAERLGYVQSTVTTHIQQLEKISGQKLFHRYPRGIEPTEAGKIFAKYAYQYVHLSLSLEESMSELELPSGKVYVRVQESFFLTRLLPFFREYTQKFLDVKLHIDQGSHQNIVNGVLDYALDFGIVPENPARHDLLFHPLIEEKIVFAMSADLADNVDRKGIQLLNNEIFVSNGMSCLYHTTAIDVLKEAGITVREAIELPSLEMIKQMVICGRGYALLPKIAIAKELEEGRLKLLPFHAEMSFVHGLIVHKNRELSNTALSFQKELLNYFTL